MAIYTRPSFPFYPDRFLGGTTLMSSAAVGAYIRMLGVSWNSGPIPATKAALVRAMGLSQVDPPYADLWVEIEPKWTRTPEGWINETLEGIRSDAEAHSLDQSARAKSGASKRRKSAGVAPESSPRAAGIQPEVVPEVSPKPAEAPAGVAPESSLRFRSSVSSSSSSSVSQSKHTRESEPATELTQPVHPRQRFAPSIVQSPKAHLSHAWCDGRVKCVPLFVDVELLQGIGGAEATRRDRLAAWYERIAAEFDGQTVAEDAPKFWRRLFARDFATAGTAVASPRRSPLAALLAEAVLPGGATVWFSSAALDGDTLYVQPAALDTVVERYLPELERTHGRPIRVVARDAVSA